MKTTHKYPIQDHADASAENVRTFPGYYAVLPASVRYDRRLKASEKILFAELTALAQKSGYAWASNRYFAELYNVSKETVSRWISHLQRAGYLSVSIDPKGIEARKIFPILASEFAENPHENAVSEDQSPLTKSTTGVDKRDNPPHDQKVKQNTTSLITKKEQGAGAHSKDPKETDTVGEYAQKDPSVRTALRDFEQSRWEQKAPLTPRARSILMRRLDALSAEFTDKGRYQRAMLEEAVLNGWKSVYPLRYFEDGAPSEGEYLHEEPPADSDSCIRWNNQTDLLAVLGLAT